MNRRIPVILDTDIGNDIDDTWALGQLLNSPELDLKLVLTSTGDTEYRARVAAKFLRDAGYGDVPVGIGIPRNDGSPETLHEYVKGFRLADYPGEIHADGIGKALELMEAEAGLAIIGIAPATNLAELASRRPELAERVRLTAMLGSIDRQHDGRPGAVAEYNVVLDLAASRRLFRSKWREFLITPLDHCGAIRLRGEEFRRILDSPQPVPRLIVEQYALWRRYWGEASPPEESSILYDTAAVALAVSPGCAELERMRLEVTPDGFLRRSAGGSEVTVAVRLPDPEKFNRRLLSVLLRETSSDTTLQKGQIDETKPEFHTY